MHRSRTVDLVKIGRSAFTAENGSRFLQAIQTIAVDIGSLGRPGWYRLKITSPEEAFAAVSITASGGDGAEERHFSAPVRGTAFGAFIYIGRDVEQMQLRLRFMGPKPPPVAATIRRLSAFEFLVRSRSKGLTAWPATYWRYFSDPGARFLVRLSFPLPQITYEQWIRRFEGKSQDALGGRSDSPSADPPVISLVLTFCDPDPTFLAYAIDSVIGQTSPGWELCICDNASQQTEVERVLARAVRSDPRIKLHREPERIATGAARNAALRMASGAFVAVLDQHDALAPRAVELCARSVREHPGTEILYSDNDLIDATGRRSSPRFKPDFSPDFLLSGDYMDRLVLHRLPNIARLGGWREMPAASGDFDLTLRILDFVEPRQVRHIPAVLYHRRASADGAPRESLSCRAVVEDTLRRRGVAAQVESVAGNAGCRVRYSLPDPAPMVSVIIPTRDRARLLAGCVATLLERTTYPHYEILVVDNDSVEAETHALLDQLRPHPRLRIIQHAGPFNYAAINNEAAGSAEGQYLCFLNNDTEVITPDWLEDLVGYASQPGVGCVGAKLCYEDDTIQHAGMVLGLRGPAGHVFLGAPRSSPGYLGRLALAGNYSAFTGACLVLSRRIFQEVGGFDAERLAVSFNDVDLCLKVRDRGYRNVFSPFAELYHFESLSRGTDETPEKRARNAREAAVLTRRYGPALLNDPFYSPNLSLRDDFALRSEK